MRDRLSVAAQELAEVSRRVRDEGHYHPMFTDLADDPPKPLPAHLIAFAPRTGR
jgi:hypothetical protein